MTAIEARTTRPPLAPSHLRSCAGDRLQSWPRRRRPWLHEALDAVAVRVNRMLDRIPLTHRIHARILRGIEFTDVPLAVRGAVGLDGTRLAFLTDLHAGSYLGAEKLVELCDAVSAQEPDVVCLGGDLINTRGAELELFDRALPRLRARHGVFAVPGNHDHHWHADMGEWQAFLEARGVTVLANRGLRLERDGTSLWLAGVDDLTDGRPDVPRAMAGRRPGEPTILLAHQPDHFVEAAGHDVDLVLSGHTHGGQLNVFGRAPITHSRLGYKAGWYERGRSRLYVSRGVGVTVLPLRLGARPEIPFVRLYAAAPVQDPAPVAGETTAPTARPDTACR